MFDYFRRPGSRPLSDAISTAMTRDGQTTGGADFSNLQMVESSGRYSDRKVTYFRVFDPASAAQRSMDIKRYKDFDVFQGLIVRSGHVEQDGTVVMTRAVVVHAPAAAVDGGGAVPMPAGAETGAAMNGAALGQTVSEA